MNRRSFLAALCALPFVGRLVPQPPMEVSFDFDQHSLWNGMDAATKARWEENFRHTAKLWAEQRDREIADMVFASGDQWPESIRKARP